MLSHQGGSYIAGMHTGTRMNDHIDILSGTAGGSHDGPRSRDELVRELAARGITVAGNQLVEGLSAEEELAIVGRLLDATLDTVIAHFPDGTLLYFNQSALDLLGYGPEEMSALPRYGWLGADAIPRAPERVEAILAAGQLTFQSSVERKDGSTVPTEVRVRRMDTQVGPVFVAVIRDITERLEAQKAIMHMAYHDTLTGLANRAFFDERMSTAISAAKRHGDVLALAFIDVDDFKPINDRFGHAVGDTVLVELGERLLHAVREEDTVARLGGDEFAVLLPRIGDFEDLRAVGRKLDETIRRPLLVRGEEISLTASIGLAALDHDHDDARSLLMRADAAMYAAKQGGGPRWCIYQTGMYGPYMPPDEWPYAVG